MSDAMRSGAWVCLVMAACASPVVPVSQSVAPVVYGEDDRRDAYDHPDPALRELAMQSVAALMTASTVDASDATGVHFSGNTLREAHNLCPTERFLTDPTAAFCSGTLIDDDLVVTAGHCITNATDCGNTRFVFGYYRDDATHLHTVTSDDVYRCAQLVVRTQSTTGGLNLDYAIARLDRSAVPRFRPAKMHLGAPTVSSGEALACVGFGSGIPAKIDSGGRVRDPRAIQRDYFVATTDTFGGNSGSGVFDLGTREFVGILVRGETDYVANGACQVVNRCASDACSGESITYGSRAVEDLCAHATSARLCPPVSDGGGVTVIAPDDAMVALADGGSDDVREADVADGAVAEASVGDGAIGVADDAADGAAASTHDADASADAGGEMRAATCDATNAGGARGAGRVLAVLVTMVTALAMATARRRQGVSVRR